MAQYLEKFNGLIGKRQTEQIFKLLDKQRRSGQINNVDEFSTKLEKLIRELTGTVLTPTLKLFLGNPNDIIDSETYNFMLDRVEDDLSAAFEEANKIDEVQQAHEAVIRDLILKNLRAAHAELEGKITLFEFLNNDKRGFDTAIFSTFRESKEERTQRKGGTLQALFLDPRTGNIIPPTKDAAIDLVGERLTLGYDEHILHNIKTITQRFDGDSPQSDLIVEPPASDLRKMIDGRKGTYWIQSLLFSKTNKKTSVKVKLELDLGITKEVNFIEIEPALRKPVILEAIHYVDLNNVVKELATPELSFIGPISTIFKKIATKKLILTFRNENPTFVAFEYDPNRDTLLNQSIEESPLGTNPTITGASEALDDILSSIKVKDIIGILPANISSFEGQDFLTGFDNIRVGRATYDNISIYLSTPIETSSKGQIGIRVVESRPYEDAVNGAIKITEETYDHISDNELSPDEPSSPIQGRKFLSSIEYWIIKQDFAEDNSLVRSTMFPILPLGVQRVYHERLILNNKVDSTQTSNDTGTTLFYTNRTSTEGNIKVYRNSIMLPDATDNVLELDGWKHLTGITHLADRIPNNGSPMRFRIQIQQPLPGDIFTVVYTPLVSSTSGIPKNINDATSNEFTSITGLQVVDMVGDLSARVIDGQIILLDQTGKSSSAEKSKLYLSIILRQNTADTFLTPAVEEYTFLAGKRNETKFKETF